MIETLEKLAVDQLQPIPQNSEEATYASLIDKDDFIIDWNKSAIAIHNQVRGFYPNCFTSFRDNKLKILATIPIDENYLQVLAENYQGLINQVESLDTSIGKPGEVVSLIKNFGPIIKTREGLLLLLEIQRSGKRPQSGWDLVNGTRLKIGEMLT